jgi:hypothetical protein
LIMFESVEALAIEVNKSQVQIYSRLTLRDIIYNIYLYSTNIANNFRGENCKQILPSCMQLDKKCDRSQLPWPFYECS